MAPPVQNGEIMSKHTCIVVLSILTTAGCQAYEPDAAELALAVTDDGDPVDPSMDGTPFDVCAYDPDFCDEACSDCADVDQCFSSGGHCALTIDGNVPHYIDNKDNGPDPFQPGCHWRSDDAACRGRRLFAVDTCLSATWLLEWQNPVCHDPQDDVVGVDCAEVCGGFGVCVTQPFVCDGWWPSAECVCLGK
jgi:hypothetical protein